MSFTTNRSSLRRKVFLGSTLLALGAFLAVGAASCVTLPVIPPNQCGNLVVEPDNGEVCDENSLYCGAPATVGACRYLCDYQDETGIQCETGFGCGLDGICRKSDGLSDSPISLSGGGARKLMAGDFDGDGRTDVVAVGFGTAEVHFLTTDGFIGNTVQVPNETGFPAVGDVNGDGRSDIVLGLDRAMGVLLGQEDQTFAPTNYPTMFVAARTQKLIPLGAYSDDGAILEFSATEQGDTKVELVTLNAQGGHAREQIASGLLDGLVNGAVATQAFTIANESCVFVAFELDAKGAKLPRLFTGARCGQELKQIDENDLPGKPWGGAFLADYDKDGDLDLFFGVSDVDATLKVAVADGGPNPLVKDLLSLEPGTCADKAVLASAPLAIGDLNKDGYPDFVDNRGVLFYNPTSLPAFKKACNSYPPVDPMNASGAESWKTAVIADFNGDGINDVMAARKGQDVIDLWSWRGDAFQTVTIFAGGEVEEIVTGDFDGDTVADAAYRLVPPMEDPMRPTPLFALFGNPLALPSTPQPLGIVRDMQRLAAGRIKGANGANQKDVLSDIVVLSGRPNSPDLMPLTLFQGNSTRNLISPLSLQENTTSADPLLSTDEVYNIYVTPFGTGACNRFDNSTDPNAGTVATPANIVALGEGKIWVAGCADNGSSLLVDSNITARDNPFLFAPVDPVATSEDPEPLTTQLAAFTATPTFVENPPTQPPPDGYDLGLGILEHLGQQNFKELDLMLDSIDKSIQLPTLGNPDAPYAFADLDGNGLREVILATPTPAQSRKIHIFWNGGENAVAGMLDVSDRAHTVFPFNPAPTSGRRPDGMMETIVDTSNILEIAALNVDEDNFKELAILTVDHVYLAKLDLNLVTEKNPDPTLVTGRTLTLMSSGQPFTTVRNGRALLSLDADSNGIDDLIVADEGKLLLFVGTERLQ